jgi:D-beta-D-heptose 7-phosphate kinase/D-beta-D-heptose 1-phosphate adenosyltransferase
MTNKTNLVPWIAKGLRPKVAIIGDIMLDEYIEGSVDRISPEAPVPVVLVKSRYTTAGGASNVARNIQLTGGQASLFGICGQDSTGDELISILSAESIATNGVVRETGRATLRKLRILSGRQQLVRVDWEKIEAGSASGNRQVLDNLSQAKPDAVMISDYGKGLLSAEMLREIFDFCEKEKIPTVVDPKSKDFSRYARATLITPNRKEGIESLSEDCTGLSNRDLAVAIHKKWGLKNLLLTLGADGMILCDEKKEITHVLTKAREVFDVSGAGDTVAAMMALGLASHLPLSESVVLANAAAGRVVEKHGTQPITADELNDALRATSESQSLPSLENKIVSAEQLLQKVGYVGKRSRRVVFTNGCFDLLHAGHVTYLREAKRLGDILVVGLNSDASVKMLEKGAERPLVPEKLRATTLSALADVDYVVMFSEADPGKLIGTIIPDVLVKGADWSEDKIIGGDVVKKHGGAVKTIDLVPGISTSKIVEKIKGLK